MDSRKNRYRQKRRESTILTLASKTTTTYAILLLIVATNSIQTTVFVDSSFIIPKSSLSSSSSSSPRRSYFVKNGICDNDRCAPTKRSQCLNGSSFSQNQQLIVSRLLSTTQDDDTALNNNRNRISRVKDFAKNIVTRPFANKKNAAESINGDSSLSTTSKGESSVTAATTTTTTTNKSTMNLIEETVGLENEAIKALDTINLAYTTTADAFLEVENDLDETDKTLMDVRTMLEKAEKRQQAARESLAEAKIEASKGLHEAELATIKAIKQAQKAESIIASLAAKGITTIPTTTTSATISVSASDDTILDVEKKKDEVEGTKESELSSTTDKTEIQQEDGDESNALDVEENETDELQFDIKSLSYDDVDYHLHEMSPPFIGEDQCLVPGETVVRVEKAPENSRRIFAGIDISASVDDVWNVLTDYEHLQNVVPNLVVNEVLETYNFDKTNNDNNKKEEEDLLLTTDLSNEKQLETMSETLRGCKLRQVGGAKVIGINFSARTTLEVREWPKGMPDFAHYEDEIYDGKSRNKRAKEGKGLPLKRYRFPRPFSLSSVPYKCISMQSTINDDGEFRMYQGVWRMQPLPGCAPPGGEPPMRLTYAVEISPRPYLPVALVENRIAQDLCANLEAIRDFVTK